MCKLRDIEEESKGNMPSQGATNAGSTTISNRTVNSSMSGTHGGGSGFFNHSNSSSSGYYNNKNNSDFLSFKNISEK
jgi:hypothetical protein